MLEKVLFNLNCRLFYTGTAGYPNLTSLLRRVNPLCEPAAGGKPLVFLPDRLVLPSLGGDNFTLGRRVHPIQRIPYPPPFLTRRRVVKPTLQSRIISPSMRRYECEC